VIDPIQQRYTVANHEAGHALAMYLCGRRIAEIDVSRPDSWAEGWVVPGPSKPLLMPSEGVDVFSYVDGHLERASRESAVIARMGALVAGDDWLGPRCARDRAIVREACPSWMSPGNWETWVLLHAEEMRKDPRFNLACRALGRALLERPHEAMSGDRAVEVMERGVLEGLLEWWCPHDRMPRMTMTGEISWD
jgi:hypothetical protein